MQATIMPSQVEAILLQIERMDAASRLLIEERLRQLAEAEWRTEAALARTTARERGINQQAIDDAVADVRYGP
jgi:hypothetical protein